MTDKLEEQLSIIIDKSIALAETTGEFVIDQGAELVQQFIMWHTASSTAGIVLGLLIIFIGYPSKYILSIPVEKGRINHKVITGRMWRQSYHDGSSDSLAGYIAIRIITSVTGLVIISFNLYYLLFILVAPKLYLVDYFTK